MQRRRVSIIVIAIVLIFVFAALIWVDVDSVQRISKLETTVNGLQTSISNLDSRVTALENKTWHSTGNFTLSPSETTVSFNTQGEAWRMIYVFNGAGVTQMTIGYNLRAYDANGNIVGGLNGIELSDLKNSGKGIIYVSDGQGTYSVDLSGVSGSYTFTFEVQSYY